MTSGLVHVQPGRGPHLRWVGSFHLDQSLEPEKSSWINTGLLIQVRLKVNLWLPAQPAASNGAVRAHTGSA